MYSDTEFITSPTDSKMYPCPAVDTSYQKLYHDETELPLGKEVEAVVESPFRKISMEELEATADVSSRKMEKDTTLENSLKMSQDESLINATLRKVTRDRSESPMDVAMRQVQSSELDSEFQPRKLDRDTKGDVIDSASRNRSELPMDVRKIIWNELQSSDVRPKKISRGMMGFSMDSGTIKMMRDDVEHPFVSRPRRITRDSMGTSLDTGSSTIDSSGRAMTMEKNVETTRTPTRKISDDELEYCTDTAAIKTLSKEQFERLMDATSCTEKQMIGLEPTSKWIRRDELETSVGSLRRRMPRMLPEQLAMMMSDDEFRASKSNSSPGHIGQPDLTVTSQMPWKSSADLFAVGPLSQLVYDGILEKSCNSMATTSSLSASTPNLPQIRVVEAPPARGALPSPVSPTDTKDDRIKDKEKSKKSLRLKNLFKKKNESSSEKLQSGLQKL